MAALGGLIVSCIVLGVLFDLKPAGIIGAILFAIAFGGLLAFH